MKKVLICSICGKEIQDDPRLRKDWQGKRVDLLDNTTYVMYCPKHPPAGAVYSDKDTHV